MAINGYNFWAFPDGVPDPSGNNNDRTHIKGMGVDDTGTLFTIICTEDYPGTIFYPALINPFKAYTFDFSAGAPGAYPSGITLAVTPDERVPTGDNVGNQGAYVLVARDMNGVSWWMNYGSHPITSLLQGYDVASGAQVSSTDIGYAFASYFAVESLGTFQHNGEAYIGVWILARTTPTASLYLQFYNVDSGTPVDAGFISITVDVQNNNFDGVKYKCFYDGAGSVFVLHQTLDFSANLTGELIKIDVATMGSTSQSFSDAWSFIGNPVVGNINIILSDGTIRVIDTSFNLINIYGGLGGNSRAWMTGLGNGTGFNRGTAADPCAAMNGPKYGQSVETTNQLFFTFSGLGTSIPPASFNPPSILNRLVDYTIETTATAYTDWGVGIQFAPSVYLSSEYAFMYSSAVGLGGTSFFTVNGDVWEFKFTPLVSLLCNGIDFEYR